MQLPLIRVIAGIHRGGHKIGKRNVGDKPAALLHLQHWLFAVFPRGDAEFSIEHPRIYADIGDGLGEAERSAPRLAIFSGLRRSG